MKAFMGRMIILEINGKTIIVKACIFKSIIHFKSYYKCQPNPTIVSLYVFKEKALSIPF
jgi:hypothetical protein